MQSIYWICFIGGGIFVFLAVIGGIDGVEIDVAADVGLGEPDFEISGGIDQDVDFMDPSGKSATHYRRLWRFNPFTLITTLKFWTFGSCFFGLTGLLIGYFQPERNSGSVFVISLLMGLFIGGMVALIFQVLRYRTPAGMASPDELVGLLATVEIPVDPETRGKIRVQFRDGSRELVARTSDDVPLKVGDSVMIVGIEGNLAWIVAESSLHTD